MTCQDIWDSPAITGTAADGTEYLNVPEDGDFMTAGNFMDPTYFTEGNPYNTVFPPLEGTVLANPSTGWAWTEEWSMNMCKLGANAPGMVANNTQWSYAGMTSTHPQFDQCSEPEDGSNAYCFTQEEYDELEDSYIENYVSETPHPNSGLWRRCVSWMTNYGNEYNYYSRYFDINGNIDASGMDDSYNFTGVNGYHAYNLSVFGMNAACLTKTPAGAPPIMGCTDAAAFNYDSEATEDDGSCMGCAEIASTEVDLYCGATMNDAYTTINPGVDPVANTETINYELETNQNIQVFSFPNQ